MECHTNQQHSTAPAIISIPRHTVSASVPPNTADAQTAVTNAVTEGTALYVLQGSGSRKMVFGLTNTDIAVSIPLLYSWISASKRILLCPVGWLS